MNYPKVGTVKYIITEKLSFEDGQVVKSSLAALEAENAKLREALWIATRKGYPTDETGNCAFCSGNYNADPVREHHDDCEWLIVEAARALLEGKE